MENMLGTIFYMHFFSNHILYIYALTIFHNENFYFVFSKVKKIIYKYSFCFSTYSRLLNIYYPYYKGYS